MAIKVQGITVIDDGRNIINGIGASFSGIITANTFVGSGASLTNISNAALTNNSVNYGGVTVSLGGTDATPAFDLSDATNYPYTSLTGITTEILGDTTPQLGGNLDLNSKFITGTGGVNVTGVVTATSFSGSGSNLTSIPNSGLSNSSVSYGGVELSLGGTDATPAFDLSDATAYPYNSLTGITTSIVGDTTPQLGGNLDLNSKFITGTGGINVTGVVTATEFSGSGASLTDIPNAALTNSSIAIGGVTLNLGDTDATPAFDLSDATAYPYASLTGITTEIVGDTTPQLGGNLDLNSKFITGTGGINVSGVITATTFSGNLPTTDLTGTITNAQLDGSIANDKLANSSIAIGGVTLNLGDTDDTPAFNLSDATAYPYTSLTGITTEILGDTTPQLGGNLDLNGNDITGTGDFNITGVITATSFDGNITGDITGNADTATSLATARTFELTGDVVASQISFDGTGNVSLAATIQPNSVALGGDTTGDYVESITGTGNQITVTSGTGEGSTPVISIPDNPTLPGTTVTVATDLQVNRNLNVDGNITIGGTSATIFAETLKITDPDLILGFRTDANGNDVSTDTTANHGGVAVASTEGSPIVSLIGAGETLPVTYKKIMWFETGAFTGLSTDAWLTNYSFGVGTTSMSAGTKFAVGNIETDFDDITSVRHINSSGVITATTFSGNLPTTDLTGTITNAQLAGSIANDKLANSSIAIGGVTLNLGDTDATPAFDLSDATAYPTSSLSGTITNAQLDGSIANDKLTNSSIAIGGVTLNLGDTDATPAFNLSDATAYPYTSLTGITTEIVGDTSPQLGGNLDLNSNNITGTGDFNVTGVITATTFSGSGANLTSIPNGALTNSSIAIGGVTLNLGDTDATPAFDLSDATAYPYTSLTGITTEIVGDTTPQLGGNLDLNSKFITGTGGINVTGVITATTFSGSGASLTDIPNGALTNSSIAIGGVTLNLGDTDATPAFDLSDATNYPTSSLSGTITNAQLDGSIANDKLANSSIAIGGVTLNLGDTDATPAFDLSDATAYPYTSLTGITTEIVGDTSPQLGGNLDINSNDIIGTGNVSITGIITATSFSGSGSALTGLTGASAATYGDASNVAQIVVDSNGRITGISEVTISGGGGSTTRTVNRYVATADQTLFPASGTISYTVGYVDVFLNGTKLDSTEFTASNGTTVTLTTGATVDDIVELVAFSSLNLSAATSVTVADESSDTTCFPLFVTEATGNLAPKSGSNLTFDSSAGILGATTFAGSVDLSGLLKEGVNITAGKLSDNLNIDLANGMIHLFTTTEDATALPNIRVDGSTSLNASMSIGQAITVVLITTTAAAGYAAELQIDGSAVTEEWLGGSAPSTGGDGGYDVYTYNIIKTADATFVVLANLVNFA